MYTCLIEFSVDLGTDACESVEIPNRHRIVLFCFYFEIGATGFELNCVAFEFLILLPQPPNAAFADICGSPCLASLVMLKN